MRARFVARLLVSFLFTLIITFVFVYNHLRTRNNVDVSFSQSHHVGEKSSHLIRRSVLLRYGDEDRLVVFSAYNHYDNITVVLASYGYFINRNTRTNVVRKYLEYSGTFEDSETPRRPLFCRLFDSQMNEILPATQSLVFPEFTVRCPPSATARFVAVSLNNDDEINASSMQKIGTPRTVRTEVAVRNIFQPTPQLVLDEQNDGALGLQDEHFFFSVCLAPLWGDAPKWLMLIEFIEYYILQGAKHISIYKQHIDELTRLVLDNYVKKGIVDVVEVNESTNCLKRHRCRHEMQLQDCVFRHRGKSKWVAMVDLDERINVNDKTLNGYMRTIEDGNYGELRFRCRWILRLAEIPNDPETWRKEGAFTPMVLWHNTSHVAPINHTTKSIIQPHKVESMGVHQVLRFASAATVFLVPPEVAVVRHYRNVRGWSYFLKEAESFGSFENTELTSNLVDNLQANVLRKVDLLFPSKGSNA